MEKTTKYSTGQNGKRILRKRKSRIEAMPFYWFVYAMVVFKWTFHEIPRFNRIESIVDCVWEIAIWWERDEMKSGQWHFPDNFVFFYGRDFPNPGNRPNTLAGPRFLQKINLYHSKMSNSVDNELDWYYHFQIIQIMEAIPINTTQIKIPSS